MTAICQICGAAVTAHRGPMLLNPGTDPAAAQAIAEISEFDLLAGRMSQHLAIHEKQSAEQAAVMFLAGKVYAMTWAESQEPEYPALREAWRTGILQMMQATTSPVAVYDGDAAPVAPAAAGAADVGSNAQKSARKVSI